MFEKWNNVKNDALVHHVFMNERTVDVDVMHTVWCHPCFLVNYFPFSPLLFPLFFLPSLPSLPLCCGHQSSDKTTCKMYWSEAVLVTFLIVFSLHCLATCFDDSSRMSPHPRWLILLSWGRDKSSGWANWGCPWVFPLPIGVSLRVGVFLFMVGCRYPPALRKVCLFTWCIDSVVCYCIHVYSITRAKASVVMNELNWYKAISHVYRGERSARKLWDSTWIFYNNVAWSFYFE